MTRTLATVVDKMNRTPHVPSIYKTGSTIMQIFLCKLKVWEIKCLWAERLALRRWTGFAASMYESASLPLQPVLLVSVCCGSFRNNMRSLKIRTIKWSRRSGNMKNVTMWPGDALSKWGPWRRVSHGSLHRLMGWHKVQMPNWRSNSAISLVLLQHSSYCILVLHFCILHRILSCLRTSSVWSFHSCSFVLVTHF